MADLFNLMNENRASLGAGSGIYTTFDCTTGTYRANGKYALLIPTIELPFISSETDTVEVRVVTSNEVTQLAGATTYQSAEANCYMHRDSIKMLEMINGKTLPMLLMKNDFSAQRVSCTVTYSMENASQENPHEGTITLTPVSAPEFVENAYPLVIPTAHFTGTIETVVHVNKTAIVDPIVVKYEGTTVSATSDDSTVASVQATANADGSYKLNITGVKKGSTLIRLKTSKTDYASWQTSILVIVDSI